MACEHITDKHGTTFICCGSRRRPPKCKFCSKPSTKLCDFPIHGSKKGKTCDAPICDDHATSVGEDRDFCPPHSKQEELQLGSAERSAEMREIG
jgi:hypothetical protein